MRRPGRSGRRLAAAALLLSLAAPPATAAGVAGDFDFWVLSLSWSPSWCEAEGDARRAAECARPFAFTVHGFWPQYVRGYPSDCPTAAREPSRRAVDAILPVMPSVGLIRHEWRKHGTCSGLDGDAYLRATAALFARIVIPEPYRTPGPARFVDPARVEAEFAGLNKLPADAIAVTCDGRRLREVRICFTRDLSGPIACPEVDRGACRADKVYLPAVRSR